MRVTEKKKPLPILSFPAVQMLYVTVRDLCTNSSNQALGMKMIADRYDMPIALGYMDLSVEAEAFGAHAVYSVDEIPTITGQLISTPEQAEALAIPEVGAERTIVNIKGIRKAKKVGKFDPMGVKIGEYSSVNQCAKDFGWNNGSMKKYIETNSKDKQIRLRGYYLEYLVA
jgi:uroporphyrinogen decarboxylase